MATGRCTNIMRCSKAKNKEIQEADKANFVCAECGKPLMEVNGAPTGNANEGKKPGQSVPGGQRTKGTRPPIDDGKRKLYALIAGVVAVIAVIVVLCMTMLSGGDKEKPVKDEETSLAADTSAVAKPDTSSVDTTTAVKPKETEKDGDGKDKEPETKPEPPVGPKTVFGGRATYNKASGVIKFNSTVTISLHDEDDNTITLRPGDEIRGAKISGGRLVGGEAVIGGESQLLTGINERL